MESLAILLIWAIIVYIMVDWISSAILRKCVLPGLKCKACKKHGS